MVLSRDVAEAIGSAGETLETTDPNGARTRLERLSQPRLRENEHDWNQTLVRHVRVPGQDGRKRSFWAPADQPDLAPPAERVASRAEAVRSLIEECTDTLGRLPTGSDLGLFPRSLPVGSRIREFFPNLMRPRLVTTAKDAARKPGARAIHVFESPFNAHGGAPTRSWIGAEREMPTLPAAAALLDDYLYAYPIAREAEQIERIRRTHGPEELELIAPLLQIRRAALAQLASELDSVLPVPLDQAFVAAESADRHCLVRTVKLGAGYDKERLARDLRQCITRRRAALAAIRAVTGDPQAVGTERVPCVGTAGTMILRSLEPLAAAYVPVDERGVGRYLVGARRFYNDRVKAPGASGELEPNQHRAPRASDRCRSRGVIDCRRVFVRRRLDPADAFPRISASRGSGAASRHRCQLPRAGEGLAVRACSVPPAGRARCRALGRTGCPRVCVVVCIRRKLLERVGQRSSRGGACDGSRGAHSPFRVPLGV